MNLYLKPFLVIKIQCRIFCADSLELYCFMQAPPVKELRKLLRIQALRCHPIYCQNGTRLNVIPVLASRSQALRYFESSFQKFNQVKS